VNRYLKFALILVAIILSGISLLGLSVVISIIGGYQPTEERTGYSNLAIIFTVMFGVPSIWVWWYIYKKWD